MRTENSTNVFGISIKVAEHLDASLDSHKNKQEIRYRVSIPKLAIEL